MGFGSTKKRLNVKKNNLLIFDFIIKIRKIYICI